MDADLQLISTTFYKHFLEKSVFLSFSLITVLLCNFLVKEYLFRSYSKNVGEIDTFIALVKFINISWAAFAPIFFRQKITK